MTTAGQQQPTRQPRVPKPRQLPGRPELYTSYAQNLRMLNTQPKLRAVLALLALAVIAPFVLTDPTLQILAVGLAASIGAIGLNLVTGYAGQVSLGHAFFIAVGAYTAAALSGDPEGRTIGLGVTNILIWLPAAGLVAAAFGVLVAPLATRLRGLYLAIVTLGLVFIGEHVFKEWRELTGGPQVGRSAAVPELFGYPLNQGGDLLTKDQKLYLLMLVALVIFAVLARNLTRSKVGRAFHAIRDRDVAALNATEVPLRLSYGTESPPALQLIAHRLAAIVPRAEFVAFPGAGHVPHVTHARGECPVRRGRRSAQAPARSPVAHCRPVRRPVHRGESAK
jgi:branched-chain amino acid transport system permease protein